METTIWLSGVLLFGVLLGIALSDRTRKLSRRMDAIDRKFALLPEYPEIEKNLRPWQKLALDPSSKIQAIKAYRDETGAGLAAAKEAVENWIKIR